MSVPITLPEDTLVLNFDYRKSITAQDLGDVFAALAKDYRRYTKGRTLVVTRLETGSLIAYLRDAIAAARVNSANTNEQRDADRSLKSFSRKLTKEISATKQNPNASEIFLKGRKSGTIRSIESILTVAADSGCDVTIRHYTAQGDSVEISISPGEAADIRQLQLEKKRIEAVKDEMPLIGYDHKSILPYDFNSASFTKSLVKHVESSDGQIPDDIRVLISSVVRMLRKHGLKFMIDEMITDLELAGRDALVAVVKQESARTK